jgi:hypothetical protein
MAEDILHFGAVRLRVNGDAKLNMELLSIDDTYSSTLLPLTVTEAPGREPMRLCNFLSQRAKLKLSTNAFDDFINVNRIIVYVKPTYTSYPM